MDQKNIFLSGEEDNYYKRNYNNFNIDAIPNRAYLNLENYIKKDMKILEIGCSTGTNLNYFNKSIKCDVYGVDPSSEAVKEGNKIFKDVNLKVGTADNLDFENEFFDLIYFGFCLYLVDRKLLSRVVSEADRVLKNNGILGIIDFDTKIPYKRKYKHFEGVFSYKYEYSKIFLSFPHYRLIEKRIFEYEKNNSDYDIINNAVSTTVLNKNYNVAYFEL